jgi:hypothetical protein
VSWTTLIGNNGLATRSFVTSKTGSVTVTLQSAAVPLGIGIGVPEQAGADAGRPCP